MCSGTCFTRECRLHIGRGVSTPGRSCAEYDHISSIVDVVKCALISGKQTLVMSRVLKTFRYDLNTIHVFYVWIHLYQGDRGLFRRAYQIMAGLGVEYELGRLCPRVAAGSTREIRNELCF